MDALLDLSEEKGGEKEEDGAPKPKFQARSLVRTFLAKTRTAWDQEPEYEEAKELLESLKG